jgi:formate-dependent nitrite reductase membrane component NrfD
MIFGALLAAWLAQIYLQGAVSPLIIWSTALFAIASAGYSAFLFAQARGRDFWQSPLLFWHLIVQALAAGASVLILIGALELITPFQFMSPQTFLSLVRILGVSLLVSLAMIFGDLFMKHGAEDAVRAGELLLTGALRTPFWLFAVGLGLVIPMGLILWPLGSMIPIVAAAFLALFGLWMYEHLWIKAGQAVPLS